jgi:hypothetical protein
VFLPWGCLHKTWRALVPKENGLHALKLHRAMAWTSVYLNFGTFLFFGGGGKFRISVNVFFRCFQFREKQFPATPSVFFSCVCILQQTDCISASESYTDCSLLHQAAAGSHDRFSQSLERKLLIAVFDCCWLQFSFERWRRYFGRRKLLQVAETCNGEAEVFPVLHAVKMYGRVQAWLHAFITSIQDSGEKFLYIPAPGPQEQEPLYPFYYRLIRTRIRSGNSPGNRTPIPQSWKP